MGNSVIIISGSQPFTQDRIDQKIKAQPTTSLHYALSRTGRGGVAALMGSFLAVLAFEVGAIEKCKFSQYQKQGPGQSDLEVAIPIKINMIWIKPIYINGIGSNVFFKRCLLKYT